jgi:hypothetical protein
MRIPVFAANWKMHKTVQEATSFVREFSGLVKSLTQVELILAPPFTALAPAAEIARNTSIEIAAQDLYFEREGAFTGEVSAIMIRDAGASHVIVGHSERRRLFGDTDEWVNRKARAAIAAELTPIVCIGETLAEREAARRSTCWIARFAPAWMASAPMPSPASWSRMNRSGPLVPARTPRRPRPTRRIATSAAAAPVVWRIGRGRLPHPLRRIGEARQHPRSHRVAGRGRRAGRRRQPGHPFVPRNRDAVPVGA